MWFYTYLCFLGHQLKGGQTLWTATSVGRTSWTRTTRPSGPSGPSGVAGLRCHEGGSMAEAKEFMEFMGLNMGSLLINMIFMGSSGMTHSEISMIGIQSGSAIGIGKHSWIYNVNLWLIGMYTVATAVGMQGAVKFSLPHETKKVDW